MTGNRHTFLRKLLIALLVCSLVGGSYAQQSPTSPARRPTVRSISDNDSSSDASSSLSNRANTDSTDRERANQTGGSDDRSDLYSKRESEPKQHGSVSEEPSPVAAAGSTAEPAARKGGVEGLDLRQFQPVEYGEIPDVESTVALQPPSAGPQRITEIVDAIANATNWNVYCSEGLEEATVRLWVAKATPAILLKILRNKGVYYSYDDDTNLLSVMTVEEHMDELYGAIERKEFRVKQAAIPDMEQHLGSLLSEKGKMVTDPRTSMIIVWDTPGNLSEMEDVIDTLDKPMEQVAYSLKHLRAPDVWDGVQNMLSEVGVAQADARSNSIIVTDIPPRQESIKMMLESLDKPLDMRTWTLNYAEPQVVLDRLADLVPSEMGPASFDEATHQISVTGNKTRLDEIDKLIKEWDVARGQVQIEAYLVSVNTSTARKLGINWQYFDEIAGASISIMSSKLPDHTTAASEGQRMSIGQLPYQVPLMNLWTGDPVTDAEGDAVLNPEFKGNRISTVLDLLDRTGDARILSRPRVTVMDGDEAIFENTEDKPYQEGGYSYYGNSSGSNDYNRVIPMQVKFVTVGTILSVLPRIAKENNIQMEIVAEDSTAEDATVTMGDQKSTVPQKRQSRAETSVMIHNGQTIVLGGLRSAALGDKGDQVPLLGDVPLLGRLFKTTDKTRVSREFMIFITPTIVQPYTQSEAGKLAAFEDEVTGVLRDDKKTPLQRIEKKLTGKPDELRVSIGADGQVYAQGKPVELDALPAMMDENKGAALVIRKHPDADNEVAVIVAEQAMDKGVAVIWDDESSPYIPAAPPASAPNAIATITPSADTETVGAAP